MKLYEIQTSVFIKFYWNTAIVTHLICLWPAKVRLLTVWQKYSLQKYLLTPGTDIQGE